MKRRVATFPVDQLVKCSDEECLREMSRELIALHYDDLVKRRPDLARDMSQQIVRLHFLRNGS